MRAILIDVANRALTEVELPDGDTAESAEAMHKHLGGYLEVAFQFPNLDTIYVDEEGLLKGHVLNWFTVKGGHQPFAGNGLVVGCDDMGNSVAAKTTIEELEFEGTITFGEIVRIVQRPSSADLQAGRTEDKSQAYFLGADGKARPI